MARNVVIFELDDEELEELRGRIYGGGASIIDGYAYNHCYRLSAEEVEATIESYL